MDRPVDTSVEARAIQLARLRALGPATRLAIAASMTDEVRAIALAGIHRRSPGITDDEAQRILATILFGRPKTRAR